MNYRIHYDRLITRARNRVLDGYRERHHVLPRCIGGSDQPENIVELTPEEHFVAHQLLVKLYPNHPGIVWASVYMAKRCTGNKSFGWLRRKHAKLTGIMSKQRLSNKDNNPFFGPNRSPELSRKIAEAQRNRSPEWHRKQSEWAKRRRMSPETKRKLSASGKRLFKEGRIGFSGWKHSLEAKNKIAASSKGNQYAHGHVASAETRAKISKALLGNTHTLGKKHSKETRDKMSLSHIGLTHSLATRAKMSIAAKAARSKRRVMEYAAIP